MKTRYLSFCLLAAFTLQAAPLFANCALTANNLARTPDADFTDHGNGTVTHGKTGLMWKQCVEGRTTTTTACDTGAATGHTWSQALTLAGSDSTGGHNDWRLPTKKELESLVETGCASPAINTTLFPNTPSSWTWNSTPVNAAYPDGAWYVHFSYGYDYGYEIGDDKTYDGVVRLVRGGQSVDTFDRHADFTPAAFSFTAATNVTTSTATESDTVTLSGLTTVTGIKISSGQYKINGGSYTSAPGVVQNGDQVTVKLTSSASAATQVSATLTVGGVTGDLAVTTAAAADTTPDVFTFTAQNNAARSTVTTSNAITVAGIDSAAAISISGGEYSVSTDGGTNWSDWSTATPATVSLNHQIKVRLTSSANYSSAATATLTIGGVDGAFSVTTEAAPAPEPSYDPPPPPTTLTISANGSGTLTSSITQATVHGGATLIIPATLAAGGVTLNLPTPGTGSASPVTLTVNGQSLNVTPGGVGTVLRVTTATVTLNGVPTVVQLISLSAGSITVSGSGQTLLSIGSGATPRLIASGGNEAVTARATLDAASGDTLLVVSGGMVVLPAANTATRSAAATQTEIHAGETVTFDSAGQIKSHRVGSTSGSGGAGDPISVANVPATLTLNATVPNLKGQLARLNDQTPEQAALGLLGTDFTLENGGQNATGVLPLRVGGLLVPVLPLGPLNIDSSLPDGVSLTADGLYQFVRSGVVMQFAPSVRDSRQLAYDLARAFSGATAEMRSDGVIVVNVAGVDYVLQPDLTTETGTGNNMGFDLDEGGHLRYRDAQGYRQVLHPAFADLATLRDILTAAIPGIVVNRNNGATTAAIGDVIYTLVPDYALSSAPAEQTGRSWWSGADGKLYIRNADGTAQGFAVR